MCYEVEIVWWVELLQGAILVYDVTSRESFTKVEDWLTELETYSTNHDCIKMLVGNKCDMEAERMVSREEGQKCARKYQMMFIEVKNNSQFNYIQFVGQTIKKVSKSI